MYPRPLEQPPTLQPPLPELPALLAAARPTRLAQPTHPNSIGTPEGPALTPPPGVGAESPAASTPEQDMGEPTGPYRHIGSALVPDAHTNAKPTNQAAQPDRQAPQPPSPGDSSDKPPSPPATPNADTGTPEDPKPGVIIRQTGSGAVVGNRNYPDQALVGRVMEAMQGGTLDSWQPVRVEHDAQGAKEYYCDDPADPSLFIKVRQGVSPNDYQQGMQEAANNERFGTEIQRAIRAHHSVINEIRLAPVVHRVIQASEVQELVQSYGYTDIAYVEPISATVDRQTGRKTVAYPWQDGKAPVTNDGEALLPEPVINDLFEITMDLEDAFLRAGVEPYDLAAGNLLVVDKNDGTKALRLLDTEKFYRIPQVPSAAETTSPTTETPGPPTDPPIRTIAELRQDLKDAGRVSDEWIGRFDEKERASIARNSGIWGPSDASLDNPHDAHSFAAWFDPTTPEGATMRSYIEEKLAAIPPDERIALEIGGTGSKLFRGMPEGFFTQTAGVSLNDLRKGPYYEGTKAADDARGHQVIEGNLLSDSTKQQVDTWLGSNKASLIIERMFAGMSSMPANPFVMAQEASHWYDRLAEGGVLFAQLPPALAYHIEPWVHIVQQQHPQLDVQLDKRPGGATVLRLHKGRGAPANLPLLSARDTLYRELRRKGWYTT